MRAARLEECVFGLVFGKEGKNGKPAKEGKAGAAMREEQSLQEQTCPNTS